MTDRMLCNALKGRITDAKQAAGLIRNGSVVAMSGYAMAGYPKAVPQALVERKEGGEDLRFSLITGANVPWLDETFAKADLLSRRVPMISGKTIAGQVNAGQVRYPEQQMCKMPRLLHAGCFGKIDVAVVEAAAVTWEGFLIPSSSVGIVQYLMEEAGQIIIEVNHAVPEELIGIHDIYTLRQYPDALPIPLTNTSDRIGKTGIQLDLDKVKYVVETDIPERAQSSAAPAQKTSLQITKHLMHFLRNEYRTDFGNRLPPVQTGFGNIANAIADSFQTSDFSGLRFFCGGVSVPVLRLLASGKAVSITAGGLEMNEEAEGLLRSIPELPKKFVLRNGDLINNSEMIGRLNLLALNSAIEVDIYGNVNASHIAGSRVVNGIGGGANFAQNSGLSVIVLASAGKNGAISNVVPMVSHVDITEHDVDVIITENGVADLRGCDDRERARCIIENCTAGTYREMLRRYLADAEEQCGGHHPQLPDEAFAWYRRLKENGTMQEKKQDE